ISALTIPEIYAQAPAAIERLRNKGDNVSADELDDLVVKLKQDQEALRIATGMFPPDYNLLNYVIGLTQTHQKRAEVLIKLTAAPDHSSQLFILSPVGPGLHTWPHLILLPPLLVITLDHFNIFCWEALVDMSAPPLNLA
ncbi:unnamed protein product, partial [Oppiella nova]